VFVELGWPDFQGGIPTANRFAHHQNQKLSSCRETLFPDDDQILRNVQEWVKERIC